MEYKVDKRISLIEYLKRGFKELKDNINGKIEETDIANMKTISEDTRQQLLKSLKKIDENAEKFNKMQEVSETGRKSSKRIPNTVIQNKLDIEKSEVELGPKKSEKVDIDRGEK